MNASKRRLASNALSVLLAVALIMGSIPFYGLFSFAASGNFSIQVVESGIVAENVSCSFSNSSDVAVSGSTSTNGVWKTGYSLGSSSDESFTFSVGGKSFTATPTDTFLIYDRADETYSFADHAVVNIITVNISSIKNNDTVKFTESPSAAALGLPIKARATFSDGSSSDLDLTWDLGDYKTDDYDGFNFDAVATVETGGLKAVPGVSIKNTYSLQCSPAADPEILFSGAKTKTISKGDSITLSPEVSGYVSRYVWYKDNHEISGSNSKDYTIASATISDSGTYKVKAVGKNGISVKTTSGITLTVKEDKMTGVSLDAYYNGEKLEEYQLSRPVSGEIKLKVSGYPDNCTFTYHVNDEVITSAEAEYTFEVTDTVDSYNCFVEIKSSKQYSDSTVSIPQITIGKSAQDSVSIVFPEAVKNSNYKLVYTEGSKFDVKLTGGTEGSFTLESSDPSVATVTQKSDDTWTVSIFKTGNFVLRAGRSGTDDYVATAPYTKMITVTKAPLASFGFDAEEYETVYNSNNNE
ncbi:MAG: immunoglobulin domain-containing protein, partial [Clostridia bacterium]|nr:immunoglobulin domain-containing protein [Clostridia bacterium]